MIEDEPEPMSDEEMAEAKRLAAEPPVPVPGAEDLPDEVRDGEIKE